MSNSWTAAITSTHNLLNSITARPPDTSTPTTTSTPSVPTTTSTPSMPAAPSTFASYVPPVVVDIEPVVYPTSPAPPVSLSGITINNNSNFNSTIGMSNTNAIDTEVKMSPPPAVQKDESSKSVGGIIGVILVVFLLIGGGVSFAVYRSNKNKNTREASRSAPRQGEPE